MDRVHHSESTKEETGLSPLFNTFFVKCALPPASHRLRELLLANAEKFTLCISKKQLTQSVTFGGKSALAKKCIEQMG